MANLSSGIKLGQRIRHIGRLAQITNVFARHGLYSIAEAIGAPSWLSPEQIRNAKELSKQQGDTVESTGDLGAIQGLPARLRRSFEELGPAFVKLGQLLSVREDLLPGPVIEELCELHNNVAKLPYSEVEAVLNAELTPEMLDTFAEINPTPLAAGSIAQVHEAKLHSGEEVVIKIQRPGIYQTISVDLALMEEIAILLEKYLPEAKFARPSSVVSEFKRATLGELDFIREGGNIAKMARNFQDVNYLELPEVFWKLTTKRVLTMSRVDGCSPLDKQALLDQNTVPKKLVERGLNMFLKMVFIDGLYHGDLHPGNIRSMPDTRIGLIDFGVMVHISRSTRENLAGMLIALIDENYERAVMHYMELADPDMDFDAQAFEHDVANALGPFVGLTLEDIRSGSLFWEMANVAARHGAPMPGELIVFVRTLASFEGIGSQLDPSFDILTAAKDFSGEIASELYSTENIKQQGIMLARDLTQLAKHAPYQVRRLLKAALNGEVSLNIVSDDLSKLAQSLDRSSSRMSISIIIAALIVGSSILTFARIGRELYSLSIIGLVGFAMAGILAVYVVISILRGNKM